MGKKQKPSSADKNQPEPEYKILLVQNKSNVEITLYIYPVWRLYPCILSITSKIIPPGKKYLYHQKSKFKYQIVPKCEKKRKKNKVLGPKKWDKDLFIDVSESLEYTEKNLDDIPELKQTCRRKIRLAEELTITNGELNYYDILGLDMTRLRALDADARKKEIEEAYDKQKKIRHRDNYSGDDEIEKLIEKAKDTLLDDEKRADYNNITDYEKGWILKRCKAIFRPDCYTEEQKKARRRRRFMMFSSFVLMLLGGLAISISTAGLATPILVMVGATIGVGLSGAGMQSGMHAINKKSIANKSPWKPWLARVVFGFIAGAITGFAAAGITAAVVGIGNIVSGAVTLGQHVTIGAGSGAVGGAVLPLASDAAKKFVDKEQVTWKQCFCHFLRGLLIGGATGAVGGSVFARVLAGQEELFSNISGQASALTYPAVRNGVRKVAEYTTTAVMEAAGQFVEERIDDSVENQHPKEHVKQGAIDMATGMAKSCVHGGRELIKIAIKNQFAQERKQLVDREETSCHNQNPEIEESLDDSIENQQSKDNVKEGVENIATDGVKSCVHEESELIKRSTKNLCVQEREQFVEREKTSCHNLNFKIEESLDDSAENQHPKDNVKEGVENIATIGVKSGAHGGGKVIPGTIKNPTADERAPLIKTNWRKLSYYNLNPKIRERPETIDQTSDATCNAAEVEPLMTAAKETQPERAKEESSNGTIRYKSEGYWFSKMIVTYSLNNDQKSEEVKGSGRIITIPSDARNIQVKFQVRRPHWGDIMKYHRFRKDWCRRNQPSGSNEGNEYEPHVFRFEKPPLERTFTISGFLWYEAVMKVTDEHHKETGEM